MSTRFAKIALLLVATASPLGAAELKPSTIDAFNRYVAATESRMDAEVRSSPFLWIDGLSPDTRTSALERLRRGDVVIERLATRVQGKPINIPDGLVHHWIGTAFVHGVTLQQTLALVEDYNHHSRYYAPEVVRSRVLTHADNRFTIDLRLRRTKVITVVLNTEHSVQYFSDRPDRAWSHSYSTRIAEVAQPGTKDEHELPVGDDHGFLWRLYSYWRFEQRDGGVYIQCEAISLTRDIPTGLGWMIGRFVESIPRESLTFTLQSTRRALEAAHQPQTAMASSLGGDDVR
jgi:hypothetical protein